MKKKKVGGASASLHLGAGRTPPPSSPNPIREADEELRAGGFQRQRGLAIELLDLSRFVWTHRTWLSKPQPSINNATPGNCSPLTSVVPKWRDSCRGS